MTSPAIALSPLVALLTLAPIAPIAFPADKPPATQPAVAAPDPKLTPEQVIKTVLSALRNNNAADDGIRITFRFASPDNQAVTGPVERFIPMVKSPAYKPLVNHDAAKVRQVRVKDDQAAAIVVVVDAKGDKSYYVWQLSRQADGALKDCWLTDGVTPIPPPDEDPDDLLKA